MKFIQQVVIAMAVLWGGAISGSFPSLDRDLINDILSNIKT